MPQPPDDGDDRADGGTSFQFPSSGSIPTPGAPPEEETYAAESTLSAGTGLGDRPGTLAGTAHYTPSTSGFGTIAPSSARDQEAGKTSIRLAPGQILFNRYLLIKKVGAGGMGEVWLVRHLSLDTERALKLILSNMTVNPESRARFQREARVMAKLNHPNAVAVHDADFAADPAFIEMEFVRGPSLNGLLTPGTPRSLHWVARILSQLCDLLQQAHDHGIVHRDLKPSNLMLLDGYPPGQEYLKVLDFGIAKILEGMDDGDPEDFKTSTGVGLFTPQYASPEQIKGAEISAKSDLYSVGVMLYEALTGFRPFGPPEYTGFNLFNAHVNVPPPPFLSMNPALDLPPGIEQVVMRCLAKNPEDRPRSALDLYDEFSQLVPPPTQPATANPAWDAQAGWSQSDTSRSGPRTLSPEAAYAAVHEMTQRMGTGQDAPTPRPVRSGKGRPIESPHSQVGTLPDQVRPARRGLYAACLALVVLALGLPIAYFISKSWKPQPPDPPVTVKTKYPLGYLAENETLNVNGWPKVIVGVDGTRFIRIAGGKFLMGDDSNPPIEIKKNEDISDDRPAHWVELSDYYIQETEVTNGQVEAYFTLKGIDTADRPRLWSKAYQKLAAFNPEKYPAVGIPHEMAEDIAKSIGAKLPTEAQWEYAARSQGLPRLYVWGDEPRPKYPLANIDFFLQQKNAPLTSPVGTFHQDRTVQGIRDLTGNVREWCRDVYLPYEPADKEHPRVDPMAQGENIDPKARKFVIRGGSFLTPKLRFYTTGPRYLDSQSDRGALEEVTKEGAAEDLGFRTVIEWPSAR